MEENKGWSEEGTEEAMVEDAPAEPGIGFMEKLTGIFIDPVNTLKGIAAKPEFWVPLIIITIVTVVMGAYNLEVLKSAKLGDMAFQAEARGLPMPDTDPSAVSLIGASAITTPIGLLIGWVIGAGILSLVVMVMGGSFRFSGLYTLMAWVSMPNIFKTIVSGLVMHGKTFESSYQMGMSQASGTAGLGLFVTGTDFLSLLLGQIDVFLIWGIVLMIIGLPHFTSLKKNQAITATIIFNVIVLVAMTGLMFLGVKAMETAMSQA